MDYTTGAITSILLAALLFLSARSLVANNFPSTKVDENKLPLNSKFVALQGLSFWLSQCILIDIRWPMLGFNKVNSSEDANHCIVTELIVKGANCLPPLAILSNIFE